jgi:hypothetical protein
MEFNMSSKIKTICALLVCLTMSACINTGEIEVFSDFGLGKNQISKIYLVTDCFILSEGEDSQNLDTKYNLDVCNELSKIIIEDIERQTQTKVVNKSITTGLQAGPEKYIKSTNENEGLIYLPINSVDNINNTKEQFILNNISSKLSSQIMDWRQRAKYVTSLSKVNYPDIKVLDLESDSVVLFLQLTGLKIDRKRAATKTAIIGILTLGGAVHLEHSAISASAIMLDNQGIPKWGDAIWFNHEFETECEMNMTKNYILQYFPAEKMDNAGKADWFSCIQKGLQQAHQ